MFGKIDAPLNDKLNNVKWGEFRVGDLFEVKTSKSIDEGKLLVSDVKCNNFIEFVGRTREKNGVKGYVPIGDLPPNEENVISVTQVGTITAHLRTHRWYASQNIFILRPKISCLFSLFVLTSIRKSLNSNFSDGYSNYPTLETLRNLIIILPISADNEIDYDFINTFVLNTEYDEINKLNTYLKTNTLNNCDLTEKEINVIDVFQSIKWKKYRIGDLFAKVKTKKVPYKAADLPTSPNEPFVLPCLTSSFNNQGLNYYTIRDNATILKNVISIPSNSDVYRAYFQSQEFTVLSDAYAIQWNYNDNALTPNQYLFMVLCINKITDLPIYSYKNKLGGWNIVKDKYIQLPLRNGNIDLNYMELLIQSLKKIMIKDVVEYANKKIAKTKEEVEE